MSEVKSGARSEATSERLLVVLVGGMVLMLSLRSVLSHHIT